jgi:hypothetical protein
MSIGGLDMRGSIALLAFPVLAVAPSAHAAGPPPSADLRMVYENPEIAKDNSGVTWHWVLTNGGVAGAQTVIATHQVSADQKIVGVSQPCAGRGNDVVCRFDSLKPGERQAGWIKTKVARAGGMLRVNAQVTWRENQSILPDLGDPSTVDASEAWGASGTDAMTEIPGQDSSLPHPG